MNFFEQILTLLTTPPGNMLYHLVLAFSVFGALQASLSHWRRSGFPQGHRMVIGLSLLLLAQLSLYASTGLGWQGLVDAHVLLPPVDRVVTLIGLVLIIWLWTFPEGSRLGDAAMILLIFLCCTFLGVSLVWWSGEAGGAIYNASWVDVVGESFALALILIGSLTLLLRRPNGWGLGLGMLVLLFAGHLSHWLLPFPDGDYAGAVRLAEMAAYPLLFGLPQRFPIPTRVDREPEKPDESARPGYTADPKTLQAFLSLATETSPDKFYQGITRITSQLMTADICLLIMPPDDNGQMVVPYGYNLIQENVIEGFILSGRQAPVLKSALERGRSLRLPSSSTSPDLQGLARVLGLKQSGHLLAVPIVPPDELPVMGLLLLTPYSDRGWTVEDQAYLSEAVTSLAAVLHYMQQSTTTKAELEQVREKLEITLSEAVEARQASSELQTQVNALQEEMLQERSRAEILAAMVGTHEALQEQVANLEAENQKLREATPAQTDSVEVKYLEQELRKALEEIARLRGAFSRADRRILETQPLRDLEGRSETNDFEVLASIAQELRQPLSSVIGYTDLLLGESVGILGALQRKFLERIKASTERMGGLVEEMIQVTVMESGELVLMPKLVDLNTVIDEAVANTISYLSEKKIALRVDLPDQLPQIRADRDAVQQVLVNLLQNAGSATPDNGEISLHARTEVEENEPGYVLVQVSDTGGGIPVEELPRVFSRLYRSDNSTIPGTGDTGVGLTSVKTLVEALGGRIWVDTDLGRGSTFSVLLPLSEEGNNGWEAGGQVS